MCAGQLTSVLFSSGAAVVCVSCYRSCLELLLQHHCRSIAFCCVSTGIFGFPNLDAAICALRTVRQWLDEDESHRQAVDCVLFCVFLEKDKDLYERHMPLFFPLTQEDLDGSAIDAVNTAAEAGTERGAGEGKDEKVSESKTHRGEQADDEESVSTMEVSRGDTVWVRSNNSTTEQPAQPTRASSSVTESDQQSSQDDGQCYCILRSFYVALDGLLMCSFVVCAVYLDRRAAEGSNRFHPRSQHSVLSRSSTFCRRTPPPTTHQPARLCSLLLLHQRSHPSRGRPPHQQSARRAHQGAVVDVAQGRAAGG